MDYEDRPTGIELDDEWRPVTSSPAYRKRQAVLTGAACLLGLGFGIGTYFLWDYLLGCDLSFWTVMSFWALGIVTFPLCIWPIIKGIHYSFSYALPGGLHVILAAYAIAASAFLLYTFGLPALDRIVWKVFIAIPGFFFLPALIADGIFNVTKHYCIEWREDYEGNPRPSGEK